MAPIKIASGFIKSSFSETDVKCVAIKFDRDAVLIRHSKDLQSTLAFTYGEWDAFIKGVKSGEFDQPI